ncbi:TolC family protein [Pedobacter sp. JY14-1]|uniref:TolC family protein n=1 Tax=Pedobacter sp. JY14-1 TaxID=3034151 RepID=UPI0023E32EDE|nr:TolC family protein [Pedobacter sp. JY14-1]
MKKLTLIITLALLTICYIDTAAQEVITIQQAIENTLNNNLQIKKSRLSEDVAFENFRQSRLAIYPSLNAGLNQDMGWGRNNLGNTGIYENTQNYSFRPGASASVDIFNGFAKLNQIRQNKILLEVGKANTDKVKNDLILQVVTSYMDILYNRDRLKAARQQLEVANLQLKQQQELLDVGNKTLADIAETRALVATAELDVTTAENALSISLIILAQLMDIPSDTRYEVQAPSIDTFKEPTMVFSAEQVYQQALNIYPDIKLAGLRTASAKKDIDISKGGYFPRVTLSGSYGSFYNYNYNLSANENAHFWNQIKNNVSKGVGLGISIPIFNGLQTRITVKRAKINYMQYQVDEQLAKNNLNKIVYQAVADLKAARSTYESATKTFNARSEAFVVTEQRYNVGLVNSLDFNTSQTNRNKAEIDMIRAKYDLLFKAKVIDYYLGKQIVF